MSLSINSPFSRSRDDEGQDLGLSTLLDTLLQYAWLIAGITAAVVALGIAYLVLATPIYRADSLVQVETEDPNVLASLQNLANAQMNTASVPIAGEIEILRSREVLMTAVKATRADVVVSVANRFPVIGDWMARHHAGAGVARPWMGLSGYAWGGEKLDLATFEVPDTAFGRAFTVVPDGSGYRLVDDHGNVLVRGAINRTLSFQIGGGVGQIAVASMQAAPSTRFQVARLSPVDAYKRIRGGLGVDESTRGSNMLRISYQSPDIKFAGALVDAVAKAYLLQNVERRSAEASNSLSFLESQLPGVRESVSHAEDALNAYKMKNQVLNVDSSASTLLTQSIDSEKRRQELTLQREELSQRFRPDHPSIRAIDQQLATLTQTTGKLNDQVNRLPAVQRDLLRLQRDVEVGNQLYISMLNNAQQLRVAKAGTVGNVRIVDFAVADTVPVAPKKGMVMAVALICGLALGLLTTFVLRALRPTIRESEEAERATGLVVYATVPESVSQERLDSSERGSKTRKPVVEGRPQVLATLFPEDAAVESLRSLRTGLAFALMGAANKNVVISGATEGLGKSFIAANLSVLLASAGQRVLVIETDLRRPQLARYFGYGRRPGLSNVLAGGIAWEEALVRGPVRDVGLDVLPAGELPPNPGELLLSERFGKLLDELQAYYDLIVMDSAPVLPVADTLAVVRHAATVFLVARSEVSTAGELRDAMRKLENIGVRPKGLIINGLKRNRVGYGYKYKYHYGYSANK